LRRSSKAHHRAKRRTPITSPAGQGQPSNISSPPPAWKSNQERLERPAPRSRRRRRAERRASKTRPPSGRTLFSARPRKIQRRSGVSSRSLVCPGPVMSCKALARREVFIGVTRRPKDPSAPVEQTGALHQGAVECADESNTSVQAPLKDQLSLRRQSHARAPGFASCDKGLPRVGATAGIGRGWAPGAEARLERVPSSRFGAGGLTPARTANLQLRPPGTKEPSLCTDKRPHASAAGRESQSKKVCKPGLVVGKLVGEKARSATSRSACDVWSFVAAASWRPTPFFGGGSFDVRRAQKKKKKKEKTSSFSPRWQTRTPLPTRVDESSGPAGARPRNHGKVPPAVAPRAGSIPRSYSGRQRRRKSGTSLCFAIDEGARRGKIAETGNRPRSSSVSLFRSVTAAATSCS